jgi:hypothetical protein
MVKICQTGLLKLNFETRPTHFPVFAKNFRRPWMKLKIFFCKFPNPWALRVSGMGGYTSKCEKSQNYCTLLYSLTAIVNIVSPVRDYELGLRALNPPPPPPTR